MNRQWRITARPQGRAKETDFAWGEEDLPALAEGQIRVRIVYLSLDPTNRFWMEPLDGYLPALPLGAVMRGITIGVVQESCNSAFASGDIVQGLGGWQEIYSGDAGGWTRLPRIPGLPLTAFFGAMGHIGFTAYFGLMDIGKPKPGETLVVTAAAGAVGSLAGQMGKIAGCRVIGIAGSDEKCDWITRELGFDGAINYRKEKVADGLARACPNGIDIDFENVGGEVMDAVLGRINLNARIVLCGLISRYNATAPVPGPYNFSNILVRRGRVQGFIAMDYAARFQEAASQIVPWLLSGKLKYRIDLVDGLRHAPAALNKLFDGTNQGKLLVKVSDEP
ncbi:MAG TPA: NADP-dependent oxidoreductase [Candidatus Acidoferrales bacterium]|nr:NADP-dependent oxidoreductase [Candidatus Acidoferrales bacterium]